MAKAGLAAWVGMMLVVLGPVVSAAQGPLQAGERLVGLAGPAQLMVRRAIAGAAGQLESEECQRLLTDFQDKAGRTLQQNLEDMGRLPSQFVRDLWYLNASEAAACHGRDIAAYTTPGTRVIYLCASGFGQATNPLSGRFGRAIIIHEMLHALGLGENGKFPTAQQITRRVLDRCRD